MIVTDRLVEATEIRSQHSARSPRGAGALSIERIDVLRSVTSQRRPRGGGVLTGAAHRELLQDAGFEPRLASRPWRGPDGLQRALLAYPAG